MDDIEFIESQIQQLVKEYHPYLFHRASWMMHNTQDAEEVIQDLWVSFYMKSRSDPLIFEMLKDKYRLRAYLFAMLKNTIIKRWKIFKSNISLDSLPGLLYSLEDTTLSRGDPEVSILRNEEMGTIYSLLSDLKHPYRTIVTLRFQNTPYSEIAGQLALKESTARSYYSRTIRTLFYRLQQTKSSTKNLSQQERPIHLLPHLYRLVLHLHDEKYLSCREIAQQLDRPTNTVKAQLRRGRKILASYVHTDQEPQDTQIFKKQPCDVLSLSGEQLERPSSLEENKIQRRTKGRPRKRSEAVQYQYLKYLKVYYRDVIVLADIKQLSYEAIAMLLGCSINTVKTRIWRGRKLLNDFCKS